MEYNFYNWQYVIHCTRRSDISLLFKFFLNSFFKIKTTFPYNKWYMYCTYIMYSICLIYALCIYHISYYMQLIWCMLGTYLLTNTQCQYCSHAVCGSSRKAIHFLLKVELSWAEEGGTVGLLVATMLNKLNMDLITVHPIRKSIFLQHKNVFWDKILMGSPWHLCTNIHCWLNNTLQQKCCSYCF